MRSIKQKINAIEISTNHQTMQLFRVIGSVDMDGHGTQHEIGQIDPFILLDEALIEGEMTTGFNKHPHAGLTAVTYLLNGTSHAWDNIHGETPHLNHSGGVYCVDTGKGIVHGESPMMGIRKIRLLQMWYNPGIYQTPLPPANYQLHQPNDLPVYEDDKLWVKIIMGQGFNLTSPTLSRWPIQYLHCKLAPEETNTLHLQDPTCQGFIYVLSGEGKFGINGIVGTAQQCLVLGSETTSSLPIENINDAPLEFMLAMGKPHNKSFVKLLGHGGAIIADTETHARVLMQEYEKNPDSFGKTA